MSTTKNIPTPAENEIRPRYEAVRSRHSKAVEELEAARQAEATAQDNVNAHLALADTKESKPKSWAHDLAELEATLKWARSRRTSKSMALEEASGDLKAAERALALAKMADRAAIIGGFNRDEFIQRYQQKLAPIRDEMWAELHLLADLETEVANIAREAGIDNGDPRYTPPPTGSSDPGRHQFDGVNLAPGGLNSYLAEEALEVGDDPRVVAAREAAAAEWTARRDAEEQERREERERERLWREHRERTFNPNAPRQIQYPDGGHPMKTSRLGPGLTPNG
ncbi:hypothetical protein M3G54_09310 [Brevibacterium casei]|uniref:hypothetical protein n=1 Tax=Brevibacterium casei TaxID=33889 RepID=UPI00223C2291|nr:hypothetical protein [Brevibacterium casei]MCT2358562.1 hypothetical protein [Brevibacterium casei]